MNSKSKSMTIVAAAMALCMAGSAFAQDRRGDDRGHRGNDHRYEQKHRHDHRDHRHQPSRYERHDRYDHRDARHFDRRGPAQHHAQWHRGGRVPTQYRGHQYVVNDWRGHHLHQPPRGYHWVGVGSQFALAAITTGVIAQIVVSR